MTDRRIFFVVYLFHMKTLGIGIFVLLVAGLLFFTIQIVKKSDFAVVPATQNKTADKKTFVDVHSNLMFDYPNVWILERSDTDARYAPVFSFLNADGKKGYFGVSRTPMKRLKTAAEDAEFYSEDAGFRDFLNEVVLRDARHDDGAIVEKSENVSDIRNAVTPIESGEISFGRLRNLTLKSGIPGFAVPYSVRGLKGTAYFLYSRDSLLLTVSAFESGQQTASESGKSDRSYDEFSAAAEAVMNTFVAF